MKGKDHGWNIIGIDPGISGAFCFRSDGNVSFEKMPILDFGKRKDIDFNGVASILSAFDRKSKTHIFLERAKPLAMGSTHAFNYGRGFAAIEIAVQLAGIPVFYVEPHVWTKTMLEGISKDLRPKMAAWLAAKRLCPKFCKEIPTNRNGKPHDGMVDALLIAEYGMRVINSR